MHKLLKLFTWIAIIVIIAFSVFYVYSSHEYDLSKVDEIKTEEEYQNISYTNVENIQDDDVLGILIIEKINLKATVKEGSKEKTLKEYIGHIEETAKYDGNIGLAAHNRLNKYSYFARLNELEKGDEVIYVTKFYTKKYKINKKVVIYDTDWSYLKNTKENKITMITCIKNKPNQRLCIQATEK